MLPGPPCGRRLAVLLLLLHAVAAPAAAGEPVWHLEGASGGSHEADRAVNPASLVKMATTLWALERLGPGHRFTTTFYRAGDDLVVAGGGDPDFQPENAFLVAEVLNRLGLREMAGRLLVDGAFWTGWENGSARPPRTDPERRRMMAARLRQAWDPRRWDREIRQSWAAFAARSGRDPERPPRLVVAGAPGSAGATVGGELLARHRSRPLAGTLRRLNAWSNNDIERLEAALGTPADLQAFLRRRWGPASAPVRLETLSGLGVNRLTPRLAVRLVRDLEQAAVARGLDLSDLLPVAGCDPGTLEGFPALAEQGRAGSVTAKTGSLTRTDGGIALLAGRARTATGDLWFCIAVPGSGGRLPAARRQMAGWLVDRITAAGGPAPAPCGAAMPQAGDAAVVEAGPPPPAGSGRP